MKWADGILRYRPGALARGSLHTMGVFGIRLVTQVALLFLLARYLGAADFGDYAAIAALAILLGAVSTLGVGFLVLIDTSKDAEHGLESYKKVLPLTLISACLLLPLYLLLSLFVIKTSTGSTVLVFIGLSELIAMPLLMVQAKRLQGLGRAAHGQLLLTVPLVARLLLLGIFANLLPDGGLLVFSFIHVTTSFLALGLGNILAGNGLLGGVVWASPDFRRVQKGLPYALMRLASLGPGEVDKTIAPRLLGSTEAGSYAMATRGVAVATLPIIALMHAVQPRILALSTKKHPAAGKLIAIVLVGTLAYGITISGLFYTVAPPVFLYLLGPEFAAAADILTLLALIAPLIALRVATGGLLIAFEMPWQRTIIEATGTMILLTIAVLSAPALSVVGFVLAIGVSETIMVLGFSATMVLHQTKMAKHAREST